MEMGKSMARRAGMAAFVWLVVAGTSAGYENRWRYINTK